MADITVVVEAEAGAEDPLAQTFLEAISSSLDALRELDSNISMRRRGTLQWVIGALHKGSPATMTVRAVPTSERHRDVSGDVITAFLDGLDTLAQGAKLPPTFTEDALEAVKRLARLSGVEKKIRLQSGPRSVNVTERIAVNVDELIGHTFTAMGSIEGTLEMVTFHNQNYFRVYDAIHGEGVPCFFDPDLVETVRAGLTRKVTVEGRVRTDRNGEPLSMRVTDMRVFPVESELPKPSQLRGLARGMTGGKKAEDYLRELRDGG